MKPASRNRKSAVPSFLSESELPLYNHLKDWRNQYCKDQGIPPYIRLQRKTIVRFRKNIRKKEKQFIEGKITQNQLSAGRMYSLGEVNFIQGMLNFGNCKNSVGLKPNAELRKDAKAPSIPKS